MLISGMYIRKNKDMGGEGCSVWHEWSRHYDTTQWAVSGIILAGVGALMAGNDSPTYGRYLVAALLTLCSLFFAASFRGLRRRVQARIPEGERDALLNPGPLRQWPVLWFIHLVLFIYAGGMVACKQPELLWYVAVGCSLGGVVFGVCLIGERTGK